MKRWLPYLAVALSSLMAVCVVRAEPAPQAPLNFVVILVDDLGWMDLGCQGSRYYETPNVDRLAASGTRFTDAYAAAAICSPTRAAILTGRYPVRSGITDWIRARFQGGTIPADGKNPGGYENGDRPMRTPRNALWLEHEEITIAEALKTAGYATCHIGKWHLGADAWYPQRQGFDVNIGGCDYGQPPRYFFPYETERQGAMPGLEQGEKDEYLTDRETAEAIKFIEAHRDKPFFVYLAHYAVHTPLAAKPDLKSKYEAKPKHGQKNAVYAAMIASVDEAAGRLLEKLDELKLSDRTVVIFTSDNGGLGSSTSNAPLRADKGTPYEGGIRVPLIVRLPGAQMNGKSCRVPVNSIDIFPTIMELADVPLPEGRAVDGESLVGLLEGDEALERDALYWHFPHYRGKDGAPYGIVRAGDYKLIRYYEDGRTELYDLRQDIGETKNLAADMPEKAKQLDMMLSKWLIGVEAKMPLPARHRSNATPGDFTNDEMAE